MNPVNSIEIRKKINRKIDGNYQFRHTIQLIYDTKHYHMREKIRSSDLNIIYLFIRIWLVCCLAHD